MNADTAQAIFSGLLLIYIIWQSHIMQRQANIMDKQAEIMKNQNKISVWQTLQTERTFKLDLLYKNIPLLEKQIEKQKQLEKQKDLPNYDIMKTAIANAIETIIKHNNQLPADVKTLESKMKELQLPNVTTNAP